MDFHPPAFLSPGPAPALGHLLSPPSLTMPPEPPAFHAFGTRNSVDRGAHTMDDCGTLVENRTCAPRSSTKHNPRGFRIESEAGAGSDLSAGSGIAVGAPGAGADRVPTTPAMLSSLSSARSSGLEANGLGKDGQVRLDDGDFGDTMIGLGREE